MTMRHRKQISHQNAHSCYVAFLKAALSTGCAYAEIKQTFYWTKQFKYFLHATYYLSNHTVAVLLRQVWWTLATAFKHRCNELIDSFQSIHNSGMYLLPRM